MCRRHHQVDLVVKWTLDLHKLCLRKTMIINRRILQKMIVLRNVTFVICNPTITLQILVHLDQIHLPLIAIQIATQNHLKRNKNLKCNSHLCILQFLNNIVCLRHLPYYFLLLFLSSHHHQWHIHIILSFAFFTAYYIYTTCISYNNFYNTLV